MTSHRTFPAAGRLAAAVAAGCAALAACRGSEPPRPFATALVGRRTLEIAAEASGVIEPITIVDVKSKASGEIVEMPVDVGDDVRKGQLLVRVEETEPRQAYAQAQADLEVARARLHTAEAALRRAEELRRSQVITDQEYEQTALEYANAKAQLVRAQAELEIARERLEETVVRAPIDGTILERNASVGQVISSPTRDVGGGTLLLRMADLTQVQVRTLVDETDIGKIQPGVAAEIRVEAFPDRTFSGEVLKVEPQAVVQQSVTMFPVIVRIENPERLLKPGMTAEVTFLVARRPDVLVVPNQAIQTVADARTVAQLALGIAPEEFDRRLAAARPAGAGQAVAADGDGERDRRLTPEERDSLRARFRRGELTEEDRQRLRALRAARSGPGAPGAPAGPGMRGGGPGAGDRPAFARSRAGGTREGVVFVLRGEALEPVPVRLGLTDWEYTEVLAGLREGDTVALLPSASLLRDQAELQERFQRFRQGVPGMRRRS